MDEKEQDNVAAFDTLFTTNRIQIMKTLLPCFDRPMQKYLAIYIKYQELQYTVSYFKSHPYHICGSSGRQNDIRQLLPALLPYCTDSQKQRLQQLEQTLSSLESYQEIMKMMEMMQAMTEESAADNSAAYADRQTAAADYADGNAPASGSADKGASANGDADGNAPASGSADKRASANGDADRESSGECDMRQTSGMELLMSMLTPRQQEMMELLKGGISHGTAGMDKGPGTGGYRPDQAEFFTDDGI